MNPVLQRAGRALARFLARPASFYRPLATAPFSAVDAALRPGDVVLVEGNTRISTAIKYLTQSTWSHAALCLGRGEFDGRDFGCNALIEVGLVQGPLGSGVPTRAICSTFIAQLFQAVRYPILPKIERLPNGECNTCYDEILEIRHYSLFAPRDFDVSPYFAIVKPTLERQFDYRALQWAPIHGEEAGTS